MSVRIENRTARYNYDILEKFEAGIDLLGPEVKSVREGQISLAEAFVHIRDGQAFLVNAHVHPYQNSQEKISPTRPRRLLLHKKEIISLANKAATGGLTLVPLAMYNKGNIFKLEVGLAKGKKKWDKREAIKKRDQLRDVENSLKI
ncbi:MAG: SsrA-binding protein SmpB [Patescibacteria group bacterium]|nr:SsrA-binding protein SmpB [Patescibacteria group bacterium]MCL5432015.1 SsrA-binding protein SmpB [Patescibacteria group bacterium]